jgi:hypothetical protein
MGGVFTGTGIAVTLTAGTIVNVVGGTLTGVTVTGTGAKLRRFGGSGDTAVTGTVVQHPGHIGPGCTPMAMAA